MTLYFVSDTHFYHANALKLMPRRPWKTVEDMNEGLINNWNSVVGVDDTVIHLGDFVLGKKVENVPKVLPRLNGTLYLVAGNHDFLPSECSTEKLKRMEDLYLSNGIKQIVYGCVSLDMFTFDTTHNHIKLCHFPTTKISDHPDQYEQRYKELHPTLKNGEWLLHGHTHAREHLTGPNLIHVGVDAEAWNYSPVSLDTILGIINK